MTTFSQSATLDFVSFSLGDQPLKFSGFFFLILILIVIMRTKEEINFVVVVECCSNKGTGDLGLTY